MDNLKELFLLDPDVIFLNHASFGACPKPVFENYQEWQHRLERQPVLFLSREFPALDRDARRLIGAYLGAPTENVVFIPNATHGVNIIARSLSLGAGDEILTSDHEYGACDYTWEFICSKTGADYIHQRVALPVSCPEEIAEQLWQGVTPRTRLIFLSHISSPTALRFPVQEICRRAREAGILTLIDGAHAPGQISLNLEETGADFYTGNCHKWMMAPKGAAFLYARKEAQPLVEPLVVSWGYKTNEKTTAGSRFLDLLQWTGTRDPAAALSVPPAIQFMDEHNWDSVRQECQLLLYETLTRVQELTQLPSIYTRSIELDQVLAAQMAVIPLPPVNATQLKDRLYQEFRIEIPVIEWQGRHFLRLSVQGYNTPEDLDALVGALSTLLPQAKI